MSNALTLAQKVAERDAALAYLAAARKALQYSVGDKQVVRANIKSLQQQVDSWERAIREHEAANAGASSPGFVTASWG